MTTTAPDRTQPATPRSRTDDMVVSAWSVVSPFGVGTGPFVDGVLGGRTGLTDATDTAGAPPFPRAGLVPDFTAAKYLGTKGTRLLDRLTAIAITTVGQLVTDYGPGVTSDPERLGLVLGTGWASVQTIMDTTKDSLVNEKPYHVDPARFPNTVMNKAAGQSAIWHGIRGPNTTITGDRLTGLLALSYAVRLVRGGHCDRVLCGTAEEHSTQRAWLEWHAGSDGTRAEGLAEGGAVFLVEPRATAEEAGRRPLLRVRTTRFRAFGEPDGAGRALADCVRGALAEIGARPGDVRLVAPLGAEGPEAEQEEPALREVLGDADARRLRCRPLTGDASGVSTGFQLAAVLAADSRQRLGAGELGLVTAIDRDGTVGCTVLSGVEGAA